MFVTKRIQKLKRKLGVKATTDPDGVMAVLQISRRLTAEGDTAIYGVMEDALSMSAPKDDAVAWWAAHHALSTALPEGYKSLGEFSVRASQEEMLALFDVAIKNQGTMNLYMAKANTKGRKTSGK